MEQRVDDAIEIEHKNDEEVLTRGRWILEWYKLDNGRPDRRNAIRWFNIGPIVRKGFRYKGDKKWRDMVLPSEVPPPVPFNVKEKAFRKAFFDTLSKPEMERLVEVNYKGAWFKPRRELNREFWREVKKAYDAERSLNQ
jgi:hypothetical protein